MTEPIIKIGELSFHGIDYLIRICSNETSLSLEIEQKHTGESWKNAFSAEYIEEITQKTGNFKKFAVFVKMLLTSLNKNSESVFLDVLTYQDLQVLKSRKQGSNAPNNTSTNTNSVMSNKRYLILTYVVEFDKVHYPLPLNFNETPDVEALKGTIKRLRSELDELGRMNKAGTSTGNSFFSAQEKDSKESLINSLRLENEYLKQKLKKGEEDIYQKKGAVEYDMTIKAKIELENELETVKALNQKEFSRLNQTIDDLQKELQAKKLEILRLQHEFADSLDHTDTNKRLTDHIIKLNEESETELFSAKKILNKQEREMEKLVQELEGYRQNDKKQKLRIKQLEMDLETALKKTSVKGISDRLYSGQSRSRGASPALSSKSLPHKVGVFGNNNQRNTNRNMSTLSNKNKYSRENSVTSEQNSGFLGRWNRKSSPIMSKNKPKKSGNVTPVRKEYKPIVPKKNLSINNRNNFKDPKKNPTPVKKNYEKPWLNNNNAKKASPLPKIKPISKKNSNEEENLYKKLEELRNRNRKKDESGKKTGHVVANKENNMGGMENHQNIDERLNKLQNLLKIAKN